MSASAEAAARPLAYPDRLRRSRRIALWLFAIAGMVFVAVLLGGLTRLTHSGLSMVEWKPLTGWIPPLTEAAWQEAFAGYRKFPEYQKLNAGMTIAEFKAIFWLEYVHRLWGRLIGVVFLVPFAVFLVRGWVERPLAIKLGALFALGGLQGALGWYMVASGLVDHPDVSQYRLASHLGLAFVIYASALWLAFGLWSEEQDASGPANVDAVRLRWMVSAMLGLVFITVIAGAFVAGLDAGLIYNTFPLMDGAFVPHGLYDSTPWILSIFEDVKTVQFNHRLLGVVTVVFALVIGWKAHRSDVSAHQRTAAAVISVLAVVQAALGVATLLMAVPVLLGAAHQAGSVVLLTSVLYCLHRLR